MSTGAYKVREEQSEEADEEMWSLFLAVIVPWKLDYDNSKNQERNRVIAILDSLLIVDSSQIPSI